MPQNIWKTLLFNVMVGFETNETFFNFYNFKHDETTFFYIHIKR